MEPLSRRGNAGDHNKLVDVVRASAIFTTFAQLTLAVEAQLEEGCPLHVVRAKDRFNHPTDFGYQDCLLNVKLDDDDHVGELQLHLRSIVDIKVVVVVVVGGVAWGSGGPFSLILRGF